MRNLTAAVHAAVLHPGPALALNGTLAVNVPGETTTMNADGSWTKSLPVSGVLGSVGKVSGTWSNTESNIGSYEGPDTVWLHNKQGAFTISFSNANPGRPHPLPPGHEFYEQKQEVTGSSGSFARATEKGQIDLIVNPSKSSDMKLGLYTSGS